MSFATGKGGIFDQVNRFYSNGNSVLVEQTPSVGDTTHIVNNTHTLLPNGMEAKSFPENMDNSNINRIFNGMGDYNSPGSSYIQNIHRIDMAENNNMTSRHEHTMMTMPNKDTHGPQNPSTNENEFNMYLDSFSETNSNQQPREVDYKSHQSYMLFGDVAGKTNQMPAIKQTQDIAKYSPGVSPTVEAAQPPQYTPYLQARNSRYNAKSSSSGKKVVKYSPNMKPIGTQKGNSYKVILPSNSSSTTPQSATFDKRQLSGNGVFNQDNINADIITDNRTYPINENPMHTTTSNSSAYADEKILRATQSPVIKPLKKRISSSNLAVAKEFTLDAANQQMSPEMGKTQSNMPIYNQLMDGSGSSTTQADIIGKNNKKLAGPGHRTVKKKEVHKEAEKHRRERLNIALDDLNDIIPPELKESDRFPSKASTVEHAAEYIRFLINELNSREIPIKFTIPEETYNPKERKGSI